MEDGTINVVEKRISAAKFGKTSSLWQHFKSWTNFLRVYLLFGKKLILVWQKCDAI